MALVYEDKAGSFFERNVQLAGFSEREALFQTTKEFIENAIDACLNSRTIPENAPIPHSIKVQIRRVSRKQAVCAYTVLVSDTGHGIPDVDMTSLVGIFFSSSKLRSGQEYANRISNRQVGTFGIGVKAAIACSVASKPLTNGILQVKTSCEKDNYVSNVRLTIEGGKPSILSTSRIEKRKSFSGTSMEISVPCSDEELNISLLTRYFGAIGQLNLPIYFEIQVRIPSNASHLAKIASLLSTGCESKSDTGATFSPFSLAPSPDSKGTSGSVSLITTSSKAVPLRTFFHGVCQSDESIGILEWKLHRRIRKHVVLMKNGEDPSILEIVDVDRDAKATPLCSIEQIPSEQRISSLEQLASNILDYFQVKNVQKQVVICTERVLNGTISTVCICCPKPKTLSPSSAAVGHASDVNDGDYRDVVPPRDERRDFGKIDVSNTSSTVFTNIGITMKIFRSANNGVLFPLSKECDILGCIGGETSSRRNLLHRAFNPWLHAGASIEGQVKQCDLSTAGVFTLHTAMYGNPSDSFDGYEIFWFVDLSFPNVKFKDLTKRAVQLSLEQQTAMSNCVQKSTAALNSRFREDGLFMTKGERREKQVNEHDIPTMASSIRDILKNSKNDAFVKKGLALLQARTIATTEDLLRHAFRKAVAAIKPSLVVKEETIDENAAILPEHEL